MKKNNLTARITILTSIIVTTMSVVLVFSGNARTDSIGAVVTEIVSQNVPPNMTGKVAPGESVHQFKARTIDGSEIELSQYKGKVLLIVNVASKCGYTPQYEGLQKLYGQYRDKGFEILAFPCNQFGGQEPGSNKEIQEFCRVNYKVSFQLMDKIDVNGPDAHPLYKFLTNDRGVFNPIKWNFTKFLIGKDGVIIARLEPASPPEFLRYEIIQALKQEIK